MIPEEWDSMQRIKLNKYVSHWRWWARHGRNGKGGRLLPEKIIVARGEEIRKIKAKKLGITPYMDFCKRNRVYIV